MQAVDPLVIAEESSLAARALEVWQDGGWAMYAIAAIALAIFGLGVHIHLALRGLGYASVSEGSWRRWIDHPKERRGRIGKLLDFVTGAGSVRETQRAFQRLRTTESAPFDRDLRVMRICVSAAPLVGLLGTVTGMLATFEGLSSGSGGDKTMALIAKGISEALITTETGLVVALPGLFFQHSLARRFDRYKAFLAHLETVCNQVLYGRSRAEAQIAAERAARQQVGQLLRARLHERDATASPAATTTDIPEAPAGPSNNPMLATSSSPYSRA